MERVIDPVIADLQSEYAEARRQHSVWRARLALLRGYVGFWKVLVVAGLLGTVSIVWHEAQVLSTVGLILAVVTVSATLLFAEPGHYVDRFPNAQANHMALRLYLIPSQLPLTVPLSLGCALLGGLTAARLRTRTLVLLVILSAALAIAMFENLERLAPNANQAFREELMGHPVARGSGEMAMDQLRERIASAGVAGLSASAVGISS